MDRVLDLTGKLLLVIILFFCTTNVLFSFPLDKIVMLMLVAGLLILNPDNRIFSAKEFTLLLSVVIIISISSVVNLIFFPMSFFPIVGLLFTIITSRFPGLILNSIYYALLIHMILGIFFLVLAYAGVPNHFVYSLIGKGFGIYSERGFTATVQTFGTLCLTWLLIYFLRRDLGLNSFIDKIFFGINCLAILGTLNRSSFLFWMIIIFFKERKLFITVLACFGLFLIKFWKEIIAFLFVTSSITARFELLQGFDISFMQSHSLKVYLFGRGTNELTPEVIAQVKWTNIKTIENGYAMLLHTFGSVGLLFYISVSLYLVTMFIKIRKWAEACILMYFFFVTPYFTQEFVSVTFYFFLSVLFLVYNLNTDRVNKKLQFA
jgi:hypothetical protein